MNSTIGKTMTFLLLALALTACSGQGAPATPASTEAPATAAPVEATAEPSAAVGGQRTFVIVPAESKASYRMDEDFFDGALTKYGIAVGKRETVGSTAAIEGQLQLNLDNLADALGENTFTVKINTFTSDQNNRDNWIRENGPRLNDYPLATFKATAIEGAPAAYSAGEEVSFKLSGDLTVREISKPVTFDVTAKLAGDTLTGVATAPLKLSDFGIDPPNFANTLTVADDFHAEVQFTAREQTQ